jgi:hypothetical protein
MGTELTEGVVEHSEVQSMRSNLHVQDETCCHGEDTYILLSFGMGRVSSLNPFIGKTETRHQHTTVTYDRDRDIRP